MNFSPDIIKSTSETLSNIQFNDIFNLGEIQRLQDSFADVHSVASIITNPDGTPITNPSNFCSLCNNIIRNTEIGRANCYKSDAALGCYTPSGPNFHNCMSGGLWDAGVSITVGGKHIANWLIGQVRNEEVNEQQMVQYADKIGANRIDFMEALNEVPVMSVEKFKKIAEMLFVIANDLSEKAYRNLHLNILFSESVQAKLILQRKNEEFEIQNKEYKRINEELKAAKAHAEESDRLKSAFLANMSHEIRTPMNGILGFAALLKESNLIEEEQKKYIQIIERSGTRMLNIINDIISISKVESGQMEISVSETNINTQIEFIYTFFKPEVDGKGMKLFFKNSLPSDEALVKTDKEKIYAILTNLVKNAIKYSDKGTIEFGYELVETPDSVETQGRASLHDRACLQLQFFVKDTGIGIPKDRQKAIFDRFVQADIGDERAFQGAGLGLSISKAFVEMLGGKIWVESEEEKGSTFYFTIPYNHEREKIIILENIVTSADSIPKIHPKVSGLKILIAEDDEGSIKYIVMAVRAFSENILKVRTGVEAVEACRNNPDIDLVLMDIKLPLMDGYEATRQIRKFNKDVIIIAQTACALIGDREKAIEAGCNDYIAKPIRKEQLMVLIQNYFN